MVQQEALIWERVMQFWGILFCLTMLRYSGLVAGIVPPAASVAEPYIVAGATWLIAGFLSMAFLCRMCCCGEVEDLDRRQVNRRIAASVPLGMVSLVHSLYQLNQRNL